MQPTEPETGTKTFLGKISAKDNRIQAFLCNSYKESCMTDLKLYLANFGSRLLSRGAMTLTKS